MTWSRASVEDARLRDGPSRRTVAQPPGARAQIQVGAKLRLLREAHDIPHRIAEPLLTLHMRSSRGRSRPSMKVAACSDMPKAETSSGLATRAGASGKRGPPSESCTQPTSASSVASSSSLLPRRRCTVASTPAITSVVSTPRCCRDDLGSPRQSRARHHHFLEHHARHRDPLEHSVEQVELPGTTERAPPSEHHRDRSAGPRPGRRSLAVAVVELGLELAQLALPDLLDDPQDAQFFAHRLFVWRSASSRRPRQVDAHTQRA